MRMLANGDTVEDLLLEYPSLTRADVMACLAYAAGLAEEQVTPSENQRRARPMKILVDETFRLPPETGFGNWATMSKTYEALRQKA